ncbi:homocysteine S-methyltransferase family protein [Clostridium lundense]|uniref:homocysteine S-methyltransferase family protein n=1 Tax=Clostridium lundense TaxID=319475 RepID=UPI000485BC1A|nr:homocysteine S-methyltransferase family protein [Clostridium lundense]
MNIKELIGNKMLVFDGAMGTMLQKVGLKAGEAPELLNIKARNKIIDIHKKYIEAGANIITTNTFGANELKLKDTVYAPEEIIKAAVENAKIAVQGRNVFIALDIGPIGELLEPMGSLAFEEAYEIFKRQVIQGVKCGVDLILIETMTDLYEAKAAVLAAKENSNLPVCCTMSFQQDRRTFTGCTALSMVMTLQGLGVDALGANCSLGPIELESIVNEILEYATIPVMVQPNAGLPQVVSGETEYKITPEEFAKVAKKMVESGVSIFGGCCGTDDNFIREVVKALENIELNKLNNKPICGACTPSKAVIIDGVRVIGERINPTGKKLFKDALRNNDMDYIFKEAIDQVEAGADILDINVGLPEINEEKVLGEVVKNLQGIIDIPLQIDSNNAKAIEKALRIYNGRAIVNSVTGENKSLDTILPLVKKYGALVMGLTLDENGIPSKAEDRYKVALKIVNKALKYGIPKENIIIDCLTLTASAQQEDLMETLKALAMVKEKLKVKTTLGVSNVSFGLPNRELLNRTFLTMALGSGLDLPIINPLDKAIMDAINGFKVLNNEDRDAKEYIKIYGDKKEENTKFKENKHINLKEAVIKGLKKEVANITRKLLEEKNEMEIMDEDLIPALDIVGEKYEKGIIFLPQLMQSAETVKVAFEIIKESVILQNKKTIDKGKILIATVKGDIHDIGKNIVKTLLQNYGFNVIDLGKDVPKEKIVEEVKRNDIKLVGLSALMTTTVKSMEETIKALRENNLACNVMVGGAVLNEEYAAMIKADFFAKDAKESVEIARKVFFIK